MTTNQFFLSGHCGFEVPRSTRLKSAGATEFTLAAVGLWGGQECPLSVIASLKTVRNETTADFNEKSFTEFSASELLTLPGGPEAFNDLQQAIDKLIESPNELTDDQKQTLKDDLKDLEAEGKKESPDAGKAKTFVDVLNAVEKLSPILEKLS